MTKRTTNNLGPKQLLSDVNKARKTGELPVTFADGGGLYLVVTDAGRARFLHKFQWQGKTKERWFPGDFPDVLLSEARDMRDADRKLLRAGVNPITAAKAAVEATKGVPTFGEYARQHVSFLAPRAPKNRTIWLRHMTGEDTDGVSVGFLAEMPIDSIELKHVKEVIEPLWLTMPTTAKQLCGRIKRVLEHRQVNAHPDDERKNPADFQRVTNAIGRKLELHPTPRAALPWEQVPAFLAKLGLVEKTSARALEMVIATGCRAGEITGARWSEINWTARTLTIPASRMKAQHDEKGEAHVIPLSLAMIRILRRVTPPQGYKPTDLIFPNGKGNAYDKGCLLDHVKALAGDEPTTHGFRSALTGWGTAVAHRARPEFARDLMEVCLAHEIGNEVSQAYLRDRWLARRRVVMREWSRFCYPPSAVVIAFRRAA
jgi:integrase